MLILLLCQTTIAQTKSPSTDAAKAPEIKSAELGETKNVHRSGNFFFSGQFSQDDIKTISNQNIVRVITLRTDDEIDWDEKEAINAAGIEFIRLPFRTPESLTDEVFAKTREFLKDNSKTTLLHCRSASRVGGVWLTFRVLDEGVPLKIALEEAKEIGLKTEFIEKKALDYIQRMQADPTINGEASVKPGINKKFIDPELDVETYVKVFEIESREVYENRTRILAACDVQPGDIVADVGAGTGLFTRLFSTAVGEDGWVYAVDISPRFIEHINKEAAKQKINNLTGVLCAENSVNLPPKSVDVVYICDTYHHFEYPKSTMTSIHRALKDDGHLIVIDFERIKGKTREWTMGHVRAGKEVFRAEIQDAGFKLQDEKKVDGLKENYFLVFKKQ